MDLVSAGKGERAWSCPHCGARAIASFGAPDPAQGDPAWLLRSGGDDDARPPADEPAEVLALIRCPTCHRRSPAARRDSVKRIAFEVASAFATVGVIALIAGALPLWPLLIWTLPVIGAVSLAFAAHAELRRWRLAARARLVRLRPGTLPLPKAIAQPGPTGTRPRLAPIEASPPVVVEPTEADEPPQILRPDRHRR